MAVTPVARVDLGRQLAGHQGWDRRDPAHLVRLPTLCDCRTYSIRTVGDETRACAATATRHAARRRFWHASDGGLFSADRPCLDDPAARTRIGAGITTPILVAPLAAWRLGERVPPKAAAGVVIGCLGIFIIAFPSFALGSRHVLAYAMLMGAAAAWAITIVTVRGHSFMSSALHLAPWQMLIAAALLFVVAMAVEGTPRQITLVGAATLAYVAPVATAFAYWAVVEAGRRFSANTMSTALLASPSFGLLISAYALQEPVNGSLLLGVGPPGSA